MNRKIGIYLLIAVMCLCNMSRTTFAQDNQKLIEYGKDPGLGIRKLNEQGYTGRGVVVAYLDQPLLYGHKAYNNVDLVYEEIDYMDETMSPSMHGPAVLSFLAGEEIVSRKTAKYILWRTHHG